MLSFSPLFFLTVILLYLYLAYPERSTFLIASSSGVALATVEKAPSATKAANEILAIFIIFSSNKIKYLEILA